MKYFKVKVSLTDSNSSNVNSRLASLCFENKNRCKVIMDLTNVKGASKSKDSIANFSSDKDARCSECFPGYILT